MNKLTINLLVGAISAILAAIAMVAFSASESPKEPDKNIQLSAIDSSLERLEQRIDDLDADPPAIVQVPAPGNDEQASRLRMLEQRIAELEKTPVATQEMTEWPEPGTQTREEEVQRVLTDWYQRLDTHDDQERDPAWAPRASASLEEDLTELAETSGFDFLHTDCKSTTCTASVEFENYDSALTGYAALLHHDYQVNCAREVLLPEPEDVQSRYLATVLYDCSAAQNNVQ